MFFVVLNVLCNLPAKFTMPIDEGKPGSTCTKDRASKFILQTYQTSVRYVLMKDNVLQNAWCFRCPVSIYCTYQVLYRHFPHLIHHDNLYGGYYHFRMV
jgi:hypothetical protein